MLAALPKPDQKRAAGVMKHASGDKRFKILEVHMKKQCGLGQTAPNPTLSTLRFFRNEYEEMLQENSYGSKEMGSKNAINPNPKMKTQT